MARNTIAKVFGWMAVLFVLTILTLAIVPLLFSIFLVLVMFEATR